MISPGARAHFVERAAELGLLERARDQAREGRPSIVIVSGEAGVGKTRLLREFVARGDDRTLWGACLPLGDRGLPLAPVVQALRDVGSDPSLADQVPPGLEPLVNATNRSRDGTAFSAAQIFQGILDLLDDLTAQAPVTLIMEDLHWADQWTRDLLIFLAANMSSQRLVLMGTFRANDVSADDALRRVIAELARHPHYHRVELAPFTVAQVAQQIELLTGDPPAPDVVDRLYTRTQGNAYFVEELVTAGVLGDRDLPASLTDLLAVRASVVSPAARQLLRVASLAVGEPDDAVLAHVSGSAVDDVRATLHELIDAHLLIPTAAGVVFRHALLKEVVQQELLAGERREYHAAYAAAMRGRAASAGHRPAATAQLAYHLHEAGDLPAAMSTWVAAAGEYEAVGALAEAHHVLANALAEWDAVDTPEALVGTGKVDLLARAAHNAHNGGNSPEAVVFARQALALVDESVDPVRAGVLYANLSNYVLSTTEVDQADDAMNRAVKLVSEAPPSRDHAHVLAAHSGHLINRGRLHEAMPVSRHAASVAREAGAVDFESRALNCLGFATSFVSDVAEGLTQLRNAVELARQAHHSLYQAMAMWNLYVCSVEAARWDDAIDMARALITELPGLGGGYRVPEMYVNLQQDLSRLGRFAEARAVAAEAAARYPFRRDDVVSTEMLVALGDIESVRQILARRDVFLDSEARIGFAALQCTLETWEGNTAQARAAADTALRASGSTDRALARAYALMYGLRSEADAAEHYRTRRDLFELEVAVQRGRHLADLMTELLDRPGPAGGWKREGGAVAAVARAEATRLEGRSDPDCWTDAVGVTAKVSLAYLGAYAEIRLAEAIVRSKGDREVATSRARHAHELATDWQTRPLRELIERIAKRTRLDLGLSQQVGRAPGLTNREHQVLELIARGASNREISQTLFISEKTTSVHVSSILRKLDVASRGEAASLAYEKDWVRF